MSPAYRADTLAQAIEEAARIYLWRRGEAKVGAADFGQRPLSSTRDAQPMNSQPGKLSVLPGRVKTGGVTPVVYDGHFRGCIHL